MPHHDHHNHGHSHSHGSVYDNKLTLPVLIIALTLALMTTFQMRQIMTERKLVRQAYETQEQALVQSAQVGKQFESLAVGTARLAGEGNSTAQGIIADMRRAGITVNPNARGDEKAIERGTPQVEGAVAPAAPNAPLEKPEPAAANKAQ